MILGGKLHAVPDPVTQSYEHTPSRPTIWQQNAALAATRNREASALTVLDVAVKVAVTHIRLGETGQALFVLEKARLRADRILGPATGAARTEREDQALALANEGRQ